MALRAAEPDKVLALPDPSFTQAADADEMKLKLIAILCDLSDRLDFSRDPGTLDSINHIVGRSVRWFVRSLRC